MIRKVHDSLKSGCIVRTRVLRLCSGLEFKSVDPELKINSILTIQQMGKGLQMYHITVIYLRLTVACKM